MNDLFTVNNGQCRIGNCTLLCKSEDAIIFELDTVDKYPEVSAYCGNEIYIDLSERSPSMKERKEIDSTILEIHHDIEDGIVFATVIGRYTMLVGKVKSSINQPMASYYE